MPRVKKADAAVVVPAVGGEAVPDTRSITITRKADDPFFAAVSRLSKRFAQDEETAVVEAVKNWCRKN